MCHDNSVAAFPSPGEHAVRKAGKLTYWEYEPSSPGSSRSVAILTDIYGCNAFYQSFATHLAANGWSVSLVDLFTELGELKEVTREAAFERRHKLRDKETCDRLQNWLSEQGMDAVVGFCIGGNFVFELAKRNIAANLVAYYPFPAGLPNQDEIVTPFEYLGDLNKDVTVLIGDADDSAGRENMAKLTATGENNASLDVHTYVGSGHGFLADLDSNDQSLRSNAEASLGVCMDAIAR